MATPSMMIEGRKDIPMNGDEQTKIMMMNVLMQCRKGSKVFLHI
jgi:hypothetical protein